MNVGELRAVLLDLADEVEIELTVEDDDRILIAEVLEAEVETDADDRKVLVLESIAIDAEDEEDDEEPAAGGDRPQ